MSDNNIENVRGRDWSIIVYPDSAPAEWRSVLDDTHMRWVESPLHDKDVNPDGEVKKAHWHVLISSDGPVSLKQIDTIAKKINTPNPQKVGSARGLVRYMVHLDNPEKYQYDISDIIGHSGAEVESYFTLTATKTISVMKDIVTYIYDNDVDNYADFLMTCISISDDWFDIAINHNTLAINKMIDAVWQKNQKNIVDKIKSYSLFAE